MSFSPLRVERRARSAKIRNAFLVLRGVLRSKTDEGAPQATYAAPSRSTPTKPLTRPPFGGHPLPQGERDTGISYAPRGWKEVLANNNQTILLPSPEKAFRNSLFVLKFED